MATPRHVSESGLERFQDDRFGMLVHWGLYSLIGANEWVMFHERYSAEEYERLATRFEAAAFDADVLVRIAADAGQRYLTITSRHHNGFSMYDTPLSDYEVTKTPFGRDPIAEIAVACGRHGLRLAFYVSLLDWHHPAYRAHLRERSGLAWSDYLEFLHGQVRELCTGYGDVAEFWLDRHWPQEWPIPHFPNWFAPGGDFQFAKLYELIHTPQPDAVVMNNNKGMNRTPPRLSAGESCQTLTVTGYGFARDVHHFRPVSELAQVLVRSAAGTAAAALLHDGGPAMSRDDQIRHGILLFEALVDMASGTPSKSEALGFGAEEIVPWRMGAVM
jgi:hypothetical protein